MHLMFIQSSDKDKDVSGGTFPTQISDLWLILVRALATKLASLDTYEKRMDSNELLKHLIARQSLKQFQNARFKFRKQ